MNPITFNDAFERAVPGLSLNTKWADGKEWLASPLFVHEISASHAGKLIEENYQCDEDIPPAPFSFLRLHLTVRFPDQTKRVLKAIIIRGEDRMAVFAQPIYDGSKKITEEQVTMQLLGPRDVFKNPCPTWPDVDSEVLATPNKLRYSLRMSLNGKPIEVASLQGEARDDVRYFCNTTVGYVFAFLFDAMSPNTHTAQVQPADERRSVEWIKARTHYTLITHGHPANKKEVREGERVKADVAGELTRMAHNRRAHYKTLKHERYRFARGKRIFVRATWVGPKEWKDEGGKQIYKILEPVDQEGAIAA